MTYETNTSGNVLISIAGGHDSHSRATVRLARGRSFESLWRRTVCFMTRRLRAVAGSPSTPCAARHLVCVTTPSPWASRAIAAADGRERFLAAPSRWCRGLLVALRLFVFARATRELRRGGVFCVEIHYSNREQAEDTPPFTSTFEQSASLVAPCSSM